MEKKRFEFKEYQITLEYDRLMGTKEYLIIHIDGDEIYEHVHDYDEGDEQFLKAYFEGGEKTFENLLEWTEDEAYHAENDYAIRVIQEILDETRIQNYRDFG